MSKMCLVLFSKLFYLWLFQVLKSLALRATAQLPRCSMRSKVPFDLEDFSYWSVLQAFWLYHICQLASSLLLIWFDCPSRLYGSRHLISFCYRLGPEGISASSTPLVWRFTLLELLSKCDLNFVRLVVHSPIIFIKTRLSQQVSWSAPDPFATVAYEEYCRSRRFLVPFFDLSRVIVQVRCLRYLSGLFSLCYYSSSWFELFNVVQPQPTHLHSCRSLFF